MTVMLETGTGAGTASKTHFCMEAQSTNLVHLNDLMHHLRNHKQLFLGLFSVTMFVRRKISHHETRLRKYH